MRGDEDPETKG